MNDCSETKAGEEAGNYPCHYSRSISGRNETIVPHFSQYGCSVCYASAATRPVATLTMFSIPGNSPTWPKAKVEEAIHVPSGDHAGYESAVTLDEVKCRTFEPSQHYVVDLSTPSSIHLLAWLKKNGFLAPVRFDQFPPTTTSTIERWKTEIGN